MTAARFVVGVFPRQALASRRRLFDALERCFPVRFEGRDEGNWSALDAAFVLPGSERAEAPPALPVLAAIYEEEAVASRRGRVELSSSELLDPRIRGRSLDDERAGAVAVTASPASAVLASRTGKSVWTAERTNGALAYYASLAPAELRGDERLRDRLSPGRFLALLPLVHFLREVGGAERSMPPPLRAAIILDDPNLHWPSYGFVRFAELAAAAEEHRFYVAIAMVPLDAWFAHPHIVSLFREKPAALSIVMHRNNHVKRELAQTLVDAERSALIAQALRRVGSFERRTGIPVARVMTPPQGACSEAMMQTMARSGVEALCISNPRPWLASPPPEQPLIAWEPADFVGGLPLLPRYRLDKPRDDLVFRAFLDQPLILYGHHQDLAGGLDALSGAAAEINSLGDVRWCSPSSIAHTNVALRNHSDVVEARLFARRVRVDVPAGIREIVAGPPTDEQLDDTVLLLRDESAESSGPVSGRPFEPFAVAGPTRLELTLVSPSAIDVSGEPSPPRRLWPVLRRIGVETRDRLVPLVPSRPRA